MGHDAAAVFDYTPRQIGGFLFLAGLRRKREAAAQLSIATAAARGEPRAVKKQIQDWTKD